MLLDDLNRLEPIATGARDDSHVMVSVRTLKAIIKDTRKLITLMRFYDECDLSELNKDGGLKAKCLRKELCGH